MQRVKSFFKVTSLAIITILVLFIVWLSYFIFKNNAPIINGNVDFGIPYKNDLKLDVYKPTKKINQKSAVIVFIHGGAWVGGNKITINNNRFNTAINQLRDQGYTVICPEYTLATIKKSSFPHCIYDIYDALGWINNNAKKYNLDLENLGIMGESAGGHIAMMVAFDHESELFNKYPKPKLKYLIDIYGPTDLEGIYKSQLVDSMDVILGKLPEQLKDKFDLKKHIFGFDPDKDTLKANQMIYQYSPLNFISKVNFPILIIHGKSDIVVPVDQTTKLKDKLNKMGIKNEIHLLDSVNHGFININVSQKDSVQNWIYRFVIKNST